MTTFVAFLGLAIAVGFIFLGGRILWLTYSSVWEKVPIAEIEASPVVYSRGMYGTTTYRPSVKYTYEYMGLLHMSRRMALFESECSGDLDEVAMVCDSLVSKPRVAFVNVRNPDLAVLMLREAKGTISQAYAISIGGMLVLIVIFGLLL